MANDLNLCMFIGRLGQDPEIHHLADGKAAANLSLAVGSSWKDQNGQKQEKTEWVRVSAFGRLAEIMGEYLRKGSQIHISGRMQTRKWQDNNGQDRYTTEIIANNMQMLGGNAQGQQGGQQQGGFQGQKQRPQQPAQQQQQSHTPGLDDGWDQDIPFAPLGLQAKAYLHCI